ncbi:hypothetical protein ABBQ38_011360 [Trebouxia sp. C0009 RCD-2024]
MKWEELHDAKCAQHATGVQRVWDEQRVREQEREAEEATALAREVEEVVHLLVAGAVQKVIYSIGAEKAAELQAARHAAAAAEQLSRAIHHLLADKEKQVSLEAETLHRHGFRRGGDGHWVWSMWWVNEDPEAANLVAF